jgi:hypothetical protein
VQRRPSTGPGAGASSTRCNGLEVESVPLNFGEFATSGGRPPVLAPPPVTLTRYGGSEGAWTAIPGRGARIWLGIRAALLPGLSTATYDGVAVHFDVPGEDWEWWQSGMGLRRTSDNPDDHGAALDVWHVVARDPDPPRSARRAVRRGRGARR